MSASFECHGLDTPDRVCFYEQDFYVLSNFSSFQIEWNGMRFATSEHLYHWLRFQVLPPNDIRVISGVQPIVPGWRVETAKLLAEQVREAPSAHAAFRLAQDAKEFQRPDWNDAKVDLMHSILIAKANQHEYVRRKLLTTGDRELVENSWRDDFWGWGPNEDGKNMLGKLWMQIRDELRRGAEPAMPRAAYDPYAELYEGDPA